MARNPGKFSSAGILIVVLALCIVILERGQIQSEFANLPGDRYDAVISASILEHWYNVFRGQAFWSDVKYFFPHTRTIAQTDAYFIVGLVYTPFRFYGFDPFLSQEFSGVLLKCIGFVGAYWITSRSLRFPFWFAVLAAVLFTLNNGMSSHSSRLQLATVALTPCIGFLLWKTIGALWVEDSRGLLLWGVATAVLFGAWCLTCFYMAWFFALYVLIFFGVSIAFVGKDRLIDLYNKFKMQSAILLIIAACAILSLSPFVWAFLPKSQEVGVRTYEMALSNTLPPEAILQVGRSNLLYGTAYNNFLAVVSPNYKPVGEYYNVGFAPALFYFFLVGLLTACRNKVKCNQAWLLYLISVSTIIAMASLIKVSGFSAWYIVYNVVPGAKALNAVSTFLLFLAFPLIVVAVYYLQREKFSGFILFFVTGVLVVGEVNTVNLNMVRNAENQRIEIRESPPKICKVFYVSGWSDQEKIPDFADWINAFYAHNVTAMMVAQLTNIPTINGIASFHQPDWNFGFPNNSDYEYRVAEYARKHRIDGLCQLDLNTKKWTSKVY